MINLFWRLPSAGGKPIAKPYNIVFLCVKVERNSRSNLLKVISPPLDYSSTIAETTQIRKLLEIIFNKLNEVMGLSADTHLLSYIK